MNAPQVITEVELPAFRSEQFAPDKVLARLPRKESVLLFDEPPGIGKTTLGQELIPAALEKGFDLVMFVAPTRAILQELLDRYEADDFPGKTIVLEPRPRRRCGDLDKPWRELERASCAALGKDELCGSCPHIGTCQWPDQLDQINADTRLVILTEQYLILNPSMIPSLVKRSEASKPLVILDEALFLTQTQTVKISRNDLEAFAKTLANTAVEHPLGEKAVSRWQTDIAHLLDTDVHVDNQPRFFAGGLEHATLAVQGQGRAQFGAKYRHLAHDLSLMNSPVTTGQWQQDGCFEIAVRVDLGQAQTVVLAPYMEAELVEERLQRNVVVANPNAVFGHSGTRVINIRDGIGSMRSMGQGTHRKRVIDTFAALVLRNSLAGKRTVLVAKKRFLNQIADQTEEFAAAAGFELRVVLATSGDPLKSLGPWDVPMINFGIVGINTLKDFDAIYTIGSYNITDHHLSGVYNRSLPPQHRHPLHIRTTNRRRRVETGDGTFSGRYHAGRAEALRRTLERRVVLQAVGRARPYTSPTEVVILQQDDLAGCFGAVEVFDTLGEFRRAMRLPTLAEIKRAKLADQMRPLQEAGSSYRDLSTRFAVSVSTAHKALQMPPLAKVLLGDVA